VLVAAALLRTRDSVRPSLTHGRTLRRFLFYGVAVAPLCSAATLQLLPFFGGTAPGLLALRNWYMGDALGIAIMTPTILAIQREELAALIKPAKRVETISLLSGLTILAGFVFAQSKYPVAFLLFPTLLLMIFRLRSSGAAIGVFLIAIPAVYFTVQGRGPFSLIRTGSLTYSIFLLQCFLCVLLVVVYAVSAALAERDRLQRDIVEVYRQADVMAGLDHMTGLANRRTFDKELSREWRRAVREHGSLSLLMIDIDYFKRYNDHYGHIAGDECLRTIAALLAKTMVRSNDLAARYGGEEFSIILPGSNEDGALMIADRLRDAIARANLRHEGSTRGYLTVSIGVATAHPTRTMEETQLVQAADTALYLAKRNGRNQVAVEYPRHPPDEDEGTEEEFS
jgi:diguanylate cyclase (GGDEF)-like protein